MCGLNYAQQLRSRVFGQVNTGDHEIVRASTLLPVRHDLTHPIARLAQPFLEQGAHEVIFLVYRNA
jgi:hypothetical protein